MAPGLTWRALHEHAYEDGPIERLGSTRTIHANVRLVAATNRDLAQLTAEKEFREDLYFRLNVFPIRIAPLREARGVIGGQRGAALRLGVKRTTLMSKLRKLGISREEYIPVDREVS